MVINSNDTIVPGVLNTVAAVSTVTQTNEVLQIIQIFITCVAAAISLAYTLWKWYKKAKADGKIDKKEQEECIDIILDNTKELTDKLKETKQCLNTETEKSETSKNK